MANSLVRFISSISRCHYGVSSRRIWTRLISGPMGISWDLTRPSARCCTWVGTTHGINTDWGMNRLRAALLRRTWGGWEAGHDPPKCACIPENQTWLDGLHPEQHGQQGKEGILPLYSALVRPHLWYCIHLWGPLHKQDMDLMEQIQRSPSRWLEGWKHLFHEERLRELGLFSLEQRRLWGDQIVAFQCLKRTCKKDRNGLLQEHEVIGQWGMDSEWKRVGLDRILGGNSFL